MVQEMEQQLADMKRSADETQEAWQEAIARASEAEERARQFEKTVSVLQEQLHVDQIHRQLWAPDRSEAPAAQVVESSNDDTLMEEPATQVVGNSSHDMSMEDHPNDVDTEMNEVNRMFRQLYVYRLIYFRGCLITISVLPFPSQCNFRDLGEGENRAPNQEDWAPNRSNLALWHWLVHYIYLGLVTELTISFSYTKYRRPKTWSWIIPNKNLEDTQHLVDGVLESLSRQ